MTILIFGNLYKKHLFEHLSKLIDILQRSNIDVKVEQQLSLLLDGVAVNTFNINDFEGDIAISIGGDGTLLTTANAIGAKNIPIMGINMGHLGFLTDVQVSDIDNIGDILLKNEYDIEERCVLKCQFSNGNEDLYALNEIAILKQDLSSMISVTMTANGQESHTYQGDGLLVATPTGSTAYNLSVGGPIVVPGTHNLIISPIAPHSLTIRPLVVPDYWKIELSVSSRSNSFLASCDGRSVVFDDQTTVSITRADFNIKIIRLKGYSFLNTLKNKLMWGEDNRSYEK